MPDSSHPLPQDSLIQGSLPLDPQPSVPTDAPRASDPPTSAASPASPDQPGAPTLSTSPAPASAPSESAADPATTAAPADESSDSDDDIDFRYSLPQAAHFAPDFHVLPPPPKAPTSQELQQQLSAEQLRVLAEITAGRGITAAAQTLGIHRSTIHRWLNHDPAFRAAYNAWRQELMELSRSRLLKGSESAIDAVLAACDRGDARIGLSLLKSLGVLSRPQIGSANARYAATEQELDRRADRVRIAKRSRQLFHQECAAFPAATDKSIERLDQLADGKDPDAPRPPCPFPPTDPKVLDDVRKIVEEVIERERNAPARPYTDGPGE